MFLNQKELNLYMDLAERVAKESSINKAQVGCVNLYSDGMMSVGWNQMPLSTFYGADEKRLHSIHAEGAASMVAYETGHSTKNSYKFITREPCLACAKQAVMEGVTAVVFSNVVGIMEGVRYLYSQGIDVVLRKANGMQGDIYFLLTEWDVELPDNTKYFPELGMYGQELFKNDAK